MLQMLGTHHNVAQFHGISTKNGRICLVLEHVDGPTLYSEMPSHTPCGRVPGGNADPQK